MTSYNIEIGKVNSTKLIVKKGELVGLWEIDKMVVFLTVFRLEIEKNVLKSEKLIILFHLLQITGKKTFQLLP